MSIKRYVADKDASITNAFKSDLLTRGTGSNTGEADTLEIFSIYAQASTGSQELSRALFSFPLDEISEDRTDGILPASGSASFFMQLYNAPHSFSTPRKFTLVVDPLTKNWDEGAGLDTDNYTDFGTCNWEQAASSSSGGITSWTTEGGDFWHSVYTPGVTLPYYQVYFSRGYEDLSIDITSLVEEWLAGTQDNYGVMVMLTSSIEDALSSSYTKKFFARGSEFFFKRPHIEARWNDSHKDQRGVFYVSGSNLITSPNNTLYYYNVVRGQLTNLANRFGTEIPITAQLWTDRYSGSMVESCVDPYGLSSAGKVSLGLYTASFITNTTASVVFDRWFNSSNMVCFYTGSEITVRSPVSYGNFPNPSYVVSMPNLKSAYLNSEENVQEIFRVSVTDKNWTPNYYSKAVSEPEVQIIEDMYYQVRRIADNLIVVPFGTGSAQHTMLSYDSSGSYFQFEPYLLEPDYMYQFEYCWKKTTGKYEKFRETFKFRIEE